MRVSSKLMSLFAVATAVCCATQKAQIENIPTATPANITPKTGNENVPQTDANSAQDNGWLSYEPAVVELRGKLTTKWFYGPPNFGENPKTDAKEEFFILILSKAINVRGNTDIESDFNRISVEHVREMELVLSVPHKNLIGKNVIVKGTLFHAFTGHHHTDVLMSVQSISLAESD